MSSKNRIETHVVLTTKYRRKALFGVEELLKESFQRSCFGQKWDVIASGVEDGNHVHLAIRSHPTIAPSEIIARIKQITTHDLWEKEKEHMKKFYWKKKRLLWGNGYFIDSIGRIPRDKVLDYVSKSN